MYKGFSFNKFIDRDPEIPAFSAFTDEEDTEDVERIMKEYIKIKKRQARLSHKSGWLLLSPPKILMFCFLGLQWCGETVTPADLINWAASGLLPYKSK